ncbi:putative Ig domain-containing protein [Pseudorhodoferax sp. Leaf274]|uniref:putative Ig domain-containing protein n=1 Tax=Pseudorhodoferax sp. Leaf274 TaxID=1736318 RepID=UPI0007038DCC|nr:putative Ig domain-containing protein [Pseudorhodoferax sp. Leaf274]KQP36134.1 hypothetical protein ASF44_16330 [Pseudorhodoferax sp. Leaf274]
MDTIYRLNQGVPSASAQIPYYDPQNGQGRRAPISAIAETVGQMLTTPGAVPGASLVITSDGLPDNATGADGWMAVDPMTGAIYARANGVWALKYSGTTSPPLEVSGTPVLNAEVGVPYPGFVIQASGGKAPYTYSDPAGSLPGGLTIHPTVGLVYGTPTVGGETGLIVLIATDATGKSVLFAPFRMEIEPQGAPLEISGTPLTSATVGVPYAFDVTVIGGDQPYTRSITGQPSGMVFTVSGVSWPNPIEGAYSGITVSVIDALGAVVSLPPFTLTVSAAAGVLMLDGGTLELDGSPLYLEA